MLPPNPSWSTSISMNSWARFSISSPTKHSNKKGCQIAREIKVLPEFDDSFSSWLFSDELSMFSLGDSEETSISPWSSEN